MTTKRKQSIGGEVQELSRSPATQNRSVREIAADPNLSAGEAAWECCRSFARERPELVAVWALGIGFLLGWRLRIW